MSYRSERAVYVDRRVRKKKYEYYITVLDFDALRSRQREHIKLNYPEFRKTFPSLKEAQQYAVQTALSMNKRFKHVHFITRFVYDRS